MSRGPSLALNVLNQPTIPSNRQDPYGSVPNARTDADTISGFILVLIAPTSTGTNDVMELSSPEHKVTPIARTALKDDVVRDGLGCCDSVLCTRLQIFAMEVAAPWRTAPATSGRRVLRRESAPSWIYWEKTIKI